MAFTIYSRCMGLQAWLDTAEVGKHERMEFAKTSLAVINGSWDATTKRAARASDAYFTDDKLTAESFLYPTQRFGEVILKGTVPRVACINIGERLTVALPFFNPVVLGPIQEIEPALVGLELGDCTTVLPLDTRIDRPLYTPVESLKFIAMAA